MRFKKGSKVEVKNKEAPSSLYDDDYQGVEKVSRKFIRPANHTLKMGIHEEDNSVRLQKSNHVVSRNRKRSSPFHSSVHESSQKVKKIKPAEIYKKVDDAFVGNQYIQASINTSLENSCYYHEMEKRKTTNGVSRILSEQQANDDDDDDDSDQCSVGSCSVVVPSGTADSDDVASFVDTSSDDEDDDDDVAVSIHIHRVTKMEALNKIVVLLPFCWKKQWDNLQHQFATFR